MFYGEPSITLRSYAKGRRGAKVRFSCAACGSSHDVDVAYVIWLLKALAIGDEHTTVGDAARLDDHACVRCGGTRWEAWPLPQATPAAPGKRPRGAKPPEPPEPPDVLSSSSPR